MLYSNAPSKKVFGHFATKSYLFGPTDFGGWSDIESQPIVCSFVQGLDLKGGWGEIPPPKKN